MTRFLTGFLALLFAGFLFAPTARAQKTHHPLRMIRGEIVAVDVQASTFDLETPAGRTVTVVVGAKTRIRVDGKQATLVDLAVGIRARVRGRPDPKNKVFRAFTVRAKTAP